GPRGKTGSTRWGMAGNGVAVMDRRAHGPGASQRSAGNGAGVFITASGRWLAAPHALAAGPGAPYSSTAGARRVGGTRCAAWGRSGGAASRDGSRLTVPSGRGARTYYPQEAKAGGSVMPPFRTPGPAQRDAELDELLGQVAQGDAAAFE